MAHMMHVRPTGWNYFSLKKCILHICTLTSTCTSSYLSIGSSSNKVNEYLSKHTHPYEITTLTNHKIRVNKTGRQHALPLNNLQFRLKPEGSTDIPTGVKKLGVSILFVGLFCAHVHTLFDFF